MGGATLDACAVNSHIQSSWTRTRHQRQLCFLTRQLMSTVRPCRGRSSRTNPVCRSPRTNASGGESSSRTTVNRSGRGRPSHVAPSRVITALEDHHSLPSSLSSKAICS